MTDSSLKLFAMNTIYNSDLFAVLHVFSPPQDSGDEEDKTSTSHADTATQTSHVILDQIPRQGFEIVDKQAGKVLFLDGLWAEMFEAHLANWQNQQPSQETVENTLKGYAELAQNPIIVH